MLDLIVEHQAGIPLLMQPLSGNTSDANDFGDVVTAQSHDCIRPMARATSWRIAPFSVKATSKS
jgi:hypothetical protein